MIHTVLKLVALKLVLTDSGRKLVALKLVLINSGWKLVDATLQIERLGSTHV